MYPAPPDRPHRPPRNPSGTGLVLAVLALAAVPALLWALEHPGLVAAGVMVFVSCLVTGFIVGVVVTDRSTAGGPLAGVVS